MKIAANFFFCSFHIFWKVTRHLKKYLLFCCEIYNFAPVCSSNPILATVKHHTCSKPTVVKPMSSPFSLHRPISSAPAIEQGSAACGKRRPLRGQCQSVTGEAASCGLYLSSPLAAFAGHLDPRQAATWVTVSAKRRPFVVGA
jgi:hypothetical protein